MFSVPIFQQDFKINSQRLLAMYVLQLVSMCFAIGIVEMNMVDISDIFWDTIPIIILPMLTEMMMAYQLLSKRIEDGTMDFLLATANRPSRILATKGVFVVLSGVVMILLVTIIGAVTNVYRLAGYWRQDSFLLLNIGACFLQFFLSGFCFFAACRSRSRLAYLRLAVLIPVVMYGIYLFYYLTDSMMFLQYFTMFSLFRQRWYAIGYWGSYVGIAVFFVGGIIFFWLGIRAFYSRILN